MRSRMAIAGHPIHPALVALPIGLFTWAFVADIVYLGTGREGEWYDISFWSGIAGTVAALVAALPGLIDYLLVAIRTGARTLGAVHMALNLTTVACFAVAIVLMLDRGAADGTSLGAVVALHGVGVALLAAAGYLGGEMVFRHHIAMVPDNSAVEQGEQLRHAAPEPIERFIQRRAG